LKKKFLKKIKEFKEDDFTKEIVVKLFYAMGYDKVVFNGGPYEKGRDLICWRYDEIGDREVAVVQVKMSKLNTSSSSNSSFQTIFVQLMQASTEEILDDDGKKYLPSTTYFLTPEDITSRHTETISKLIQDNRNVKLIDGTKLYKLMRKHLPNVIDNIITNPNELKEKLLPKVINSELYNALKIFSEKDVNKYYADLNIDYKAFHIDVSNKNEKYVTLSISQWKEFESFILGISNCTQEFKHIINLEDIEIKYLLSNSPENFERLKKLNKKYDKLTNLLSKINKEIKTIIHSNKENNNLTYYAEAIKNKFETYSKSIYLLKGNKIPLNGNDRKNIRKEEEDLLKSFQHIFYPSIELKPLFQVVKEIIEDKKTVIEIKEHFILINHTAIEEYIATLVSTTIKQAKKEDRDAILNIIIELNKIYNKINIFKSFFPNLKIKKNYQHYDVFDIELNVSDFLTKKINLLVEGDAGAGKTTTLQFLTKNSNKLNLYFPLSKMSEFIKIKDYIKKKDLASFVSSMYEYIQKTSTITMSSKSFEEILKHKDTSLMFDGLDEVLHVYPWIFEAIDDFSKYYDGAVCTTARIGYIRTFNDFVTIRLKEFNSKQLSNFIYGWFHNNKLPAQRLINHIKINNMDCFLRNPLTATILCSLEEKNVPLPKTEINLYEERLRLFYGDYDLHKQVKRTKSHREDLDYIARKTAFIFHSDNKRNMPMETIEKELISLIGEEKYSKEQIHLIVNELVRPCNILIEEEPNSYSFGHLRYQEYLVAKELTLNRGLEIINYLSNYWWKGSLILFSQLTDDIEFIINQMHRLRRNSSPYIDMIKELITVRPECEHKRLLDEVDKLVDKYVDIEETYHSLR